MTIVWNAQRISDGLREIESARSPFLEHLKSLLDEYHGVTQSLRFYDIILGDWCERFLHAVYVGLQANDFTLHSGQGVVEIPESTQSFFADYRRLPQAMNLTISLLKNGGVKSIKLDTRTRQVSIKPLRWRRDPLISRLIHFMAARTKTQVLFVRPFSGQIPFPWVMALFRWRKWARHDDLYIHLEEAVQPDISWRRRHLVPIGENPDLFEASTACLGAFLPLTLLEGYASLSRQIMAARPIRPKIVYSAQSIWNDLAFKVLVANWTSQGTRLHYHQHGGCYGIDETHVAQDYECKVADTYYTWGWRGNSLNTRPLSPPFNLPKKCQQEYDSLICFDQPREVYRLQYFPMPGTLPTLFSQTTDFIGQRKSKYELHVRLFPGGLSPELQSSIIKTVPETIFASTKRIRTQYSKSRMVVHAYLGTTWLETLAMNIATVCFYDPNSYRFSQEAKGLIEGLLEVGILHTSGSAAAAHTNEIDDDVDSWWGSLQVQNARTEFTRVFANFSPRWEKEWHQEFKAAITMSN